MAKLISGSLYVESYTPSGIPGEYTFDNGIFVNQNDSGNGAYDITTGFVIYIPATNVNTGTIIPGVSNRYLLTSITIVDTSTISGTIVWDSLDTEEDVPSPGVYSIVTQTTPNLKLGVPPVDNNYADLTPGSTLAVMLNDLANIMDRLGGNALNTTSAILPVTTDGQTEFNLEFVPKNKEATDLTVNGLKYVYGTFNDFIIFDKVLTWTGLSLALDVTDTIVVKYNY